MSPDTVHKDRGITTLVHEARHMQDSSNGRFAHNNKPFYSAVATDGNFNSMMNAKFGNSTDFRQDAATLLNQPSSMGIMTGAQAELSARQSEKQYLQSTPTLQQQLPNWKADWWTTGYPMHMFDRSYDDLTKAKMNPMPVFVDNDTYPAFPRPSETTGAKLALEAYPYLDTQRHFFQKEVGNTLLSN